MRKAATAGAAFLAALRGVLLPRTAVALFEDEVGQYEWMLQQVGRPAALAYSGDASDRVFVASASGVVASLLLRDGTVQWRRSATMHGGVRLLRASKRGILSVTEKGTLQVWKGSTGDLTWQRNYSDGVLDILVPRSGTKQIMVILRESEVEARTMAGKHDWSVSASGKAVFWVASVSPDEGAICALSAARSGAGAAAVQIDASNGNVLKKTDLPSGAKQNLGAGGASYLAADAHLVVLVGNSLAAYSLCAGTVAGDFDLSKLKSNRGGGRGPFKLMPWQRTAGVLAVSNGGATEVFGLGPKGIKHLRTFEGVAVVGPVFSVHEDEQGHPVAVAVVKEGGTQVQLMDPASGNVQPAIHAQGFASSDHGTAELLLVHELSSGEHRTVISAADHSLAGIQGAKVSWVREEGLASIRQAVFYSRSAAAISAERAARPTEVTSLSALRAQLAGLPAHLAELAGQPAELIKAFAAWVTPRRSQSRGDGKLMPNARVPTSSEELRDFGADKLIITATRCGKLFALEATTSEIVWDMYLGAPPSECGATSGGTRKASNSTHIGGCSPWMRLLPNPASPYSELLVVVPGPGPSARILWIEPLEGTVLHQEAAPKGAALPAAAVSALPLKGDAPLQPIHPFLLIDSKRNVFTMPTSTPQVHKLAQDTAERLFHYEIDRSSQAVHGFVMNKYSVPGRLQLSRLWNLELGAVGERILTYTAPKHRAWDHVPVHIKGDASILYKYINGNLLAVATEHVRGNSSSLNLYAIDAVTGHVLHQSHIPGGAQPVHLVACDNWIIMHYHNPKKTRFELTVVELFQAKADDGPWNIIFGGRQVMNQTKSAHHLETPVPLQQTYILPAGLTAMGVTATKKGITPRSIIMALTTEHIFRVSKDMLNPRRPYPGQGPGDKDRGHLPQQFALTKDEVLMPYAPILPLRHTDVLTYYNAMGQVEGIISSPSALESTSLVFCFGLDLFFMPVQTAKGYDVLSPGFNYVLLACSVGLVLAVFVVTSFWASRKALQDRWR